mgnify:CR=1 FL=1
MLVPWPVDTEQYVFTSHTSLITQKALIEKLQLDQPYQPVLSKTDSFIAKSKENFKKQAEIKERRKQMRPQTLDEEEDEALNVKRIKVTAIDFDWIFKGKNAKTFLKLLNKQ